MMWKYVNFVIAWVGWKFYNAGNSHLTFEGIILIYRWWATSRTTNHRLLVRVHRDRRCRRWSLFMGAGWQSHCLCSKRKEATKSQKSQLTNTRSSRHKWLMTKIDRPTLTEIERYRSEPALFFLFYLPTASGSQALKMKLNCFQSNQPWLLSNALL